MAKANKNERHEVGDVVSLKCSTVPMVIERIQPDGVCICVWLDAGLKAIANGFLPTSLQAVK
jgi:uncharacterized protein YodC (DUF2158 family)